MNSDIQSNQAANLLARIGKFTENMLPMFLGVLLGFAINNWQKARTDAQFVERTLVSLREEHRANATDVKDKLKKHYQYQDSLKKYALDSTVKIGDVIRKFNGFQTPSLRTTFWQAVLSQSVQLMDYEIISLLTQIQQNTEELSLLEQRLAAIVYEKLYSAAKTTKRFLWL